jgi:hypothetical protein
MEAEMKMNVGTTGRGWFPARFFSLIGTAAAFMLFIAAGSASAQTYSFTFTSSGGMDATGTIDVTGGLATTGTIDVTGVPVEASPSTLIDVNAPLLPGDGSVQNVENHNGDVVTYDNLVNFANDPILDGNGLGFGSDLYSPPSHYNTLVGLNGGDVYGNLSPGLYTLFVGEASLNQDGSVAAAEYVYYYDSGTLTYGFSSPAPEPSSCVLILAAGAMGLRRRRRAAA